MSEKKSNKKKKHKPDIPEHISARNRWIKVQKEHTLNWPEQLLKINEQQQTLLEERSYIHLDDVAKTQNQGNRVTDIPDNYQERTNQYILTENFRGNEEKRTRLVNLIERFFSQATEQFDITKYKKEQPYNINYKYHSGRLKQIPITQYMDMNFRLISTDFIPTIGGTQFIKDMIREWEGFWNYLMQEPATVQASKEKIIKNGDKNESKPQAEPRKPYELQYIKKYASDYQDPAKIKPEFARREFQQISDQNLETKIFLYDSSEFNLYVNNGFETVWKSQIYPVENIYDLKNRVNDNKGKYFHLNFTWLPRDFIVNFQKYKPTLLSQKPVHIFDNSRDILYTTIGDLLSINTNFNNLSRNGLEEYFPGGIYWHGNLGEEIGFVLLSQIKDHGSESRKPLFDFAQRLHKDSKTIKDNFQADVVVFDSWGKGYALVNTYTGDVIYQTSTPLPSQIRFQENVWKNVDLSNEIEAGFVTEA